MSIYKDEPRGTWYIAYNYTDDNGKRKQYKRRGFKTKKEATASLTEFQNDLLKGTYIIPSRVLFSDYIVEWLKAREYAIKKQTASLYHGSIKLHINPFLGEIPISKISPNHIQQFISFLYDKKLASSTICRIFSILNTCLNSAVKEGLIRENAATKVMKPKYLSKEIHVWSIEEIMRFLTTAKDDLRFTAFFLALMTGMRQGEILGLRWQDINFEKRLVSIRQTLDHDGKNITPGTKSLKRKISTRTISISEKTVEELKRLKSKVEYEKRSLKYIYEDNDLVICTDNGKPVNPRNLTRSFKRLIKKAGVSDIRFHDLRHTHVALMISQNEPVKLIAERLGHSKITTTMDTYGHLLPNMQMEATDRLDDTLFGS